MTHQEWLSETEKCTKTIYINSLEELKTLISKLHFDKRKAGYHGRALFSDYPAKNLVKGDGLEPSRGLRDVHELDLGTIFH